jgi:arabinofuranosyltransferase
MKIASLPTRLWFGPISPSRRGRWSALAAGILGTILILLWGLRTSPFHAFDDAFITFRYAENLRNGLGLVYNPGEVVLGTTTPLFALLLGALGLLLPGAEMAQIGHWLGVAGWMAAAWSAMALFRHHGRPLAGIAAALIVALHPLLFVSLGMETPLLVGLMLFSAWAWSSDHRRLAVLSAAALLLVRQDTALWLLVLGAETWRRRQRRPGKETAAVVLLTLPWFAYA